MKLKELRERKDALQLQEAEIPKYLLRIPAFMEDKTDWRGSATDLLAALGETEVSPQAVRKHLVDYSLEVLFRAGIEYKTHRYGSVRMIILQKSGMDDESDANDDCVRTGILADPVPSLVRELPSFPSSSSFSAL